MEEEKKQKLVIEGNAFYELDMDCIRQKNRKKEQREQVKEIKRQRK